MKTWMYSLSPEITPFNPQNIIMTELKSKSSISIDSL